MKRVSENKKSLSAFWTIVLYVLISLSILAISVYLQPGSAANTLKNFLRDPRLLALNLLPILAVLGLTYALLGNLLFAGSVTGLLFHVLSLVNLIKVGDIFFRYKHGFNPTSVRRHTFFFKTANRQNSA